MVVLAAVLITGLQRIKMLQSPAHHHRHHVNTKDSHYCVLTDLLNPALDRCGFWRGMEFLIRRVFGVKKRDDDALLELVVAGRPGFLDQPAR